MHHGPKSTLARQFTNLRRCPWQPQPYVWERMTAQPPDSFPDASSMSASAAEQLFEALYLELHQLAERQLRRGGSNLSLGTTTLLHEAYLQFAGRPDSRFHDRGSFMAYAARVMRGLVIDFVRRSRAQKRGNGAFTITLSALESAPHGAEVDELRRLEQISDALDELGTLDSALAQLVDLHYFCGFSLVEIAGLRTVSERTVQRDWRKARLLLQDLLR